MKEILEKHPEFKDSLKDFTYFDNTTTASILTSSSMPTIMTGKQLQTGKNIKENVEYCFESTDYYNKLNENGYDVNLFIPQLVVPSKDVTNLSNRVDKKVVLDFSSNTKIVSLLYKCVGYRYMPHFLKRFFMVDGADFNRVSSTNVDQYKVDDVDLYNRLSKDGIKSDMKNKQYQMVYLEGVHVPYIVTDEVKYDRSSEYQSKSDDEKRQNQCIASLKILFKYVEKMKESGVYDNTTIIFTADHGWTNRYNPVFLIKPKNTDKEFSINHAPISNIEDIIPTVLNTITNSKENGKDIWDYSEGEIRSRKVYNYVYDILANNYKVLSKVELETLDDASDYDSYKVVSAEFYNRDVLPEKEYPFGKEISIIKNKNLKYAVFEGFLETESRFHPKGTNMFVEGKVKVSPKEDKDSNIKCLVKIDSVYFDNQEISINIDGNELYRGVLNKSDSGKEIEFEIPNNLWNGKDIVEVKFEFLNATLASEKIPGEEQFYLSIVLDSICFN